jgi:hypothetical protein
MIPLRMPDRLTPLKEQIAPQTIYTNYIIFTHTGGILVPFKSSKSSKSNI